MKKRILALAALAALPTGRALADAPPQETSVHVAPYVGAFLPTGALRDVLDDAVLTGVTASFDANAHLAIVASFGWAPTAVKSLANGDVDLFQYDLGLQGHYAFDLGREWLAKPFVGAGIGGRWYRYRDVIGGDETDPVAYVSAGSTFEYRQLALSLTVRDEVSQYKSLGLEDVTEARNDLGLFAAVGWRF